MQIKLTREPFAEYIVVHLPNGVTEEMEYEQCKEWFRVRGAKVRDIEPMLDEVWNSYEVNVEFGNYKEPSTQHHSTYEPQL